MKKMLKVAAIFMSAAFVMLVLACPQNEPTPSPEPTPTPGPTPSPEPTPTLTPFTLSVDVPTAKRNTALELTVNLTTEGQVKRVLYKEGTHDKYAMLGASSGATAATATGDNKKWTFTVNKNAKFTVVAEDDLDRSAITEVDINCFDFTPPNEVTNLTADYDEPNKLVMVSWENPTDEDFSYTELWIAEGSGALAKECDFTSGEVACRLDVADDTISSCTVLIKTVDTLGNTSSGAYKSVAIASTATEPYTILPAGTDGTAGTKATYILFGTWPQTIKSDTVTVDKNTAEQKTVGMFTYYKGSDNEWYCEALENAYGTEEQYKYTNGEQVAQKSANSYKWFKVEPIKWRVLTDNYSGKKLIFCESGIYADIYYYDSYDTNRDIGGSTIYPNNYEHSRIRAWLNGLEFQLGSDTNSDHNGKGFFQTAFAADEQAAIAMTTVDNSVASTGDTSNSYVCGDTNDKVFLLSRTEAANNAYFADNSTRIRKPSDFALANSSETEGHCGYWWLRSPSHYNGQIARHVSSNGFADNHNHTVINQHDVVVPALSLAP